jgi:starch phosphorylase
LGLTEPAEPAAVRAALERCLVSTVGKDPARATGHDWFLAAAALARETLAQRWVASRRRQPSWAGKRVHYLSMEFLIGRLLTDTLRSLGLFAPCREALSGMGLSFEDIAAEELDPALGNGGLGRLAACLMDSLATLGIPAYGYGLRFEYGLFTQKFEGGRQIEKPDHWLRHGYAWEFPRTDIVHRVRFGAGGADDVFAVAHDVPVPGHGATCVNTLRLWAARALREFDTDRFNSGDHVQAVEARTQSETLTRVLYPGDSTAAGRALRFRQEFFFVSASVQDILDRHLAEQQPLTALPDRVVIAINDTHPALVVPELMRLLVDHHGLPWASAWDIARRTVCYTNHTLMPEALETWPVGFFETMLPRHLDIVYRINADFLDDARRRFPDDAALLQRLSMVDESHGRSIRMAHVAFAGSRRINGVSKVHTDLMKRTVFADFHRLYPDRIVNVTNGVTPRRWLAGANPALAALIAARLGEGWLTKLDEFGRLAAFADDAEFRRAFAAVKRANKLDFARHAQVRTGVAVNPDSLFDVHAKRIHEYKRQLLKLLHAIALYNRLRGGDADVLPRTVIFAGKAAPSYAMAKLIIRLINDVAGVVNADPAVGDRLKIVFVPNYSVSEAELIMPAADLSEQISTAGTEASGTGNMKLTLNGALTVGTLDGANIEIADAVGPEHFFAFGHDVAQVERLRRDGYDPRAAYAANGELRAALDLIDGGHFSPDEPDRYRAVIDSLLGRDHFLVLADFADYLSCQARVDALYRDRESWTRWAILNVARSGFLSSDRAVADYAAHVWEALPAADGALRRRA